MTDDERMLPWHRAAIALGLALIALLSGTAAVHVGETADELQLWRNGGVVSEGRWPVIENCFQGPLPLYLNQLGGKSEPVAGGDVFFTDNQMERARLSMLPVGLLAGFLVFRIARRMFGVRGGLLALFAFALHPLAWGYASLVAVDMTFTAFALLAMDAVLMHAARPSLGRVVWAGVAVGLCCATKFLAFLLGPALLAAVCWHAARDAEDKRALRALRAGGVLLVAALVALHAAYGFRAGLGWGDFELRSEAMERALATPLVAQALALFPEPMLRGLDYQLAQGARVVTSYFAGSYDAGHPTYHLVGLTVKTPPVLLVAILGACVLGVRRLLGADADRARRDATLLFLGTGGVLFVYLSFFAKLQVGVRYVLPLVPMACVLVGTWADARGSSPGARIPERARRFAAAALLLATAGSTAFAWPNGIAYFQALSGGPAAGWRLYTDSNADWGQERLSGQAAIEARHPDVQILGPTSGPRMGLVAIYVRFRAPRDPEDPSRPRHWLDPFEPVDHEGAAWLVYDVTAEGWRAAADEDARARADLAVALLGAGEIGAARAEIAQLPPERAAGPGGILRAGWDAAGNPIPPTPASAGMLAGAWLAVGREDRCLDALEPVLGDPAVAGDPRIAMLTAHALLRQERFEEAVAALEAPSVAAGESPEHALLLAELYRRTFRLEDGIALLSAEVGASADPSDELSSALQHLRDQRTRWQTYLKQP